MEYIDTVDSDPTDTANTVFTRLQRSGPLCPSQLSLDLGMNVQTVKDALLVLWKQGIAERSTDPAHPNDIEDEAANFEDPWRIRFRGKKVRLERTRQLEAGEPGIS